MVVLDSMSNGYRDIILPLACQDEVLGRAVSVVAAFHLAQKAPDLRRTAEVGHHAIVEKLRRDSLQLAPAELFNPYTLATILVLLVGETITGGSNYVYLLEMLSCIIQSPDCIPALPAYLGEFFLQQVKMFELFGFPLSNEAKGLQTLTGLADDYLSFMSYPQLTQGSEDYSNLTLMRGAIRDACGIYRRRAESSLDQDESIHIIDKLQQKVEKLDSNTKGAHALVWTYFIAAAESVLPEHRLFFSKRLAELHEYTGFGCIPAALDALGTIWGMQGVRRWTEIVANDIPILVM
ncbi:Fc.00g095660.m01.CDS01 [Cosmosporella sp. VM-42]